MRDSIATACTIVALLGAIALGLFATSAGAADTPPPAQPAPTHREVREVQFNPSAVIDASRVREAS